MKPKREYYFSYMRFINLRDNCREAIKFSEGKMGEFVIDGNNQKAFYEDVQKRYDFSCSNLVRRITDAGIQLPEKLLGYNKEFLKYESDCYIGNTFSDLLHILKEYEKNTK